MNDLIFESTRCEFKLDLEINKPKSWLKTVSAFANGIGGSIYFGISDKRFINGLSNTKEASERITELINVVFLPSRHLN